MNKLLRTINMKRSYSSFSIAIRMLLLILCSGSSSYAQYPGQHKEEIKVPIKARLKAYSFELQDVGLLPGRFKENMDREGAWMLSLPVERLLHSFKVNAGMFTDKKTSPTKMPKPLGGWESLDMELRGHSIGHLMNRKLTEYIKSVENQPLTFKITDATEGADITLIPYYDLHRERYVVYWDLK